MIRCASFSEYMQQTREHQRLVFSSREPDAVDDADRLRLLAVAQDDLAAGRAGGVDQPLDLQRGVDVRVGPVAVVRSRLAGSKGWNPVARMIVPTSMSLNSSVCVKSMALPIAGLDAGLLALSRLELQARLGVDQDDLGRGLREGDVDRLPLAQADVELVGESSLLVDAGLDALHAADAEVLVDVAGLPRHLDLVVADVAVDARPPRSRSRA